MTAVLKWNVPVDDEVHEVGAGPIALVACQHGVDSVQVWTVETADHMNKKRAVRVFGTGQPLPEKRGAHIGSVVAGSGALIWHVFEMQR